MCANTVTYNYKPLPPRSICLFEDALRTEKTQCSDYRKSSSHFVARTRTIIVFQISHRKTDFFSSL